MKQRVEARPRACEWKIERWAKRLAPIALALAVPTLAFALDADGHGEVLTMRTAASMASTAGTPPR